MSDEILREYQLDADRVWKLIQDVQRGDKTAHERAVKLIGKFIAADLLGSPLRTEFLADLLGAVAKHIDRVTFELAGRLGRN